MSYIASHLIEKIKVLYVHLRKFCTKNCYKYRKKITIILFIFTKKNVVIFIMRT